MARKKSTPLPVEPVEAPVVELPAPEPVVEAPPPPVVVAPVLPAAPVKYRVQRGGRFVVRGAVHHLATGSVVSEITHDLRALAVQGFKLEPV